MSTIEAPKNEPVQVHRSMDPSWWLLGFVMGLAALWLPDFLKTDDTGMSRWLLTNGALFLAGALLGSFRPDRVWRWGIAPALALPIADTARYFGNVTTSPSQEQIFSYLLRNSPAYLLQIVPALLGAYIASLMAGKRS